MGSVGKPFILVFIYILNLNSLDHVRWVSGATVLPSTNISSGQHQKGGCNLVPVCTDQKTNEQLLPIQNNAGGLNLQIEQGREIKISCGNGNSLLLSYVKGTEFLNSENKVEQVPLSKEVYRSKTKKSAAIVHRNGTCYGKGTNFDVELVTGSKPSKFYTACVDEATSGALYSSSYLDGESIAKGLTETGGGRPDFQGTEFYPFNIKQAYKWGNVFEHLSVLIGSSELVDEYFPTSQYRFSRGHLFPNADGISRSEKFATFYYMNTVPQWQILNAGNWALIEQDVRNYAKGVKRTLKIVTGSSGVTHVKDSNNNNVELYLTRGKDGKLRLPVPRFVWKVIHDPVDNSAVAIVQINNPWAQVRNLQADGDLLCNDVCDSLPWVRSSKLHVPRKGYTYCCDVKELRKRIPYIPDIKYGKLLGADSSDSSNHDAESDYENTYKSTEDEVDGSSDSSESSSDSSSSEYYLKEEKHFEHNLTSMFSSMNLGAGS